jgi:hypothetical protein
MRRLLLLLILVAVALAAQAPAWLLERSVEERSGGMVALRNVAGTIWNGEADAVVRGKSPTDRDLSLGRLAWRVAGIDWHRQAVLFDVRQTPAGPRSAVFALGADHIRLAGSTRLPAAVGGRVPLLRGWTLGGEIVVDTDALEWANGTGAGAATALWRGASVVPPDLPGGFVLGEVSARVTLDGAAVTVAVRNSGGDIELTGDASSAAGTVALLLQPRAGAAGTSAAQMAWLQSHTMGRTPRGYTIDARWPGR